MSFRKLLWIAAALLGAVSSGCGAQDIAANGATEGSAIGVPASVSPLPLLSKYERSGAFTIAGDVGFSVPLPNGEDLWIRGDTPVYRPPITNSQVMHSFVLGTSAAEGPYAPGMVPQALAEIPTPSAHFTGADIVPSRFLKNPGDLYLPNSTRKCTLTQKGQYPAAWATGAVLDPASYSPALGYDTDVMITFAETCIFNHNVYGYAEGWGFAEYDWRNNSLTTTEVYHPRPHVGLPAAALLGTPVAADGQIYLFSSPCGLDSQWTCAKKLIGAEVADNAAALRTAADYRYFDPAVPGGFTSDPAIAMAQPGSLIPRESLSDAGLVDLVRQPGIGYLLVAQVGWYGKYELWRAPAPFGPWALSGSGTVPGCDVRVVTLACHAYFLHPELSDAGGIAMSYFGAAENHLVVLMIPLPGRSSVEPVGLLVPSTSALSSPPGRSTHLTLTLRGAPGPASLSAPGLPSGVTARFDSTTLSSGSSTHVTLSVSRARHHRYVPLVFTATTATGSVSVTVVLGIR